MRMPTCLISGLCSAVAAPMPLLAATANELPAAQWNIVPEQTLAQMRGGMDLGQLVASFAMDRVVEVNGAVVAQAHLVISNLDQLGKGGLPTISVSGPLAQVVQILGSGAVNVVTPPSSGAAAAANVPVATTSSASSSVPNATAASLSNASAPATPSPSVTSTTPSSAAGSTPTPASAQLVNAPAASAQSSPGVAPQVAPSASAGAIVVASTTTGGSVPLTPGQAVAPGNLPTNAAIGTAVQNSLNSAMIQAQTTISASLNSLGQLNSMTLANAIRQQVYTGH